MKRWHKKYEWVDHAQCGDSSIHTMENPNESERIEAEAICTRCMVRPECIEWALREKASSVFVAGVYLPDPSMKRELRLLYNQLQESIPSELAMVGEV
jgi:hypothetical protein